MKLKDLKHSWLASNIYLARQCAAVSTHWSLSRLPPQKWNPWLVWRDTCHGQRLRAASVPPTIIVPGMGPFSPSKPPMCSGTVKMNHTNSVLCTWEFHKNSFFVLNLNNFWLVFNIVIDEIQQSDIWKRKRFHDDK